MSDPHLPQACESRSAPLDFDISMAFQPIVDLRDGSVFAYEALVRGLDGEPARTILDQVTDQNRFAFDQRCRVRAVELAAKLGVTCRLSINFMPNAVDEPTNSLRSTLEAAASFGFPIERIVFETAEDERVRDRAHLQSIMVAYKHQGFMTAIDDFGAGYAGLNLLAEFQPDIVKLDMALVRGIHEQPKKRNLIAGMVALCGQLEIQVIAEGVEVESEMRALEALGCPLQQGFLFARPARAFPAPRFPD
jgi:EAL domain-containing protein (putative c-di-GMP-specific phosphodiesterase class I)